MSLLADHLATALMPPGTVSLTFDDGPGAGLVDGAGPATMPIAEYLADQGLTATFFMCGKHVLEHPDVPAAVLALGHHIGNHTQNHLRLTDQGEDLIRAEVRATLDLLVASGVPLPIPLRPPYGAWDARCAAALNADVELSEAHAGVYGWDVDASDWEAWARGEGDTGAVADDYYRRTVGNRGGVVLMHDSSADTGEYGERLRAGIRTLEVVTNVVPRLMRARFAFAPLPPPRRYGRRWSERFRRPIPPHGRERRPVPPSTVR